MSQDEDGALDPVKPSPRERIRSQDWDIGMALPNEAELAREYAVSVGTMRKALQQLETMGWISRHQGRGTFVTDPQQVSFERVNRLALSRDDVPNEENDYLEFGHEPTDERDAAVLRLRPGGQVLKIRQRRMIAGQFRLIDEFRLSENRMTGLLDQHPFPHNLSELYFRKYGIVISRCVEHVHPTKVDETTASLLMIAPGAPALDVYRIDYDLNDAPVQTCRRKVYLEEARYIFEVA